MVRQKYVILTSCNLTKSIFDDFRLEQPIGVSLPDPPILLSARKSHSMTFKIITNLQGYGQGLP